MSINRYGEEDVRPGHFEHNHEVRVPSSSLPVYETVPWSKDPRSEHFGEHTGKGPRGWARSGEKIREDVCEALFLSPDVDASDVSVKFLDGTVTLQGTVHDRDQKRGAEVAVESVSGVRDIINNLKVSGEGKWNR